MSKLQTHERTNHVQTVKMGENDAFGFVIAAALCVVAFFSQSLWVLVIGFCFGSAAYFKPSVLTPLNKLWFKFGLLLHKIISPIIMSVVYIFAIVPTGMVMRIMGKDLLRNAFDPNVDTYWIAREESAPSPESFKNQF